MSIASYLLECIKLFVRQTYFESTNTEIELFTREAVESERNELKLKLGLWAT